MDTNGADLLKVQQGKAYIIIGEQDGKYLVLHAPTKAMRVISKASLGTISTDVGNLTIENGAPKVTDISMTRLNEVMQQNTLNFSYIVARYRTNTSQVLGYLALVFQNKTNVQLVKLSNIKALELFEYGRVLNAKRVTREGKEIISGIHGELPEIEIELPATAQKVTNEKLLGREKKDLTKEGKTVEEREKYLDKVEKRFLGNFKTKGYSTYPHSSRDWVKLVQRLLTERVFKDSKQLQQWYQQSPTINRAIQIIDIYLFEKYDMQNPQNFEDRGKVAGIYGKAYGKKRVKVNDRGQEMLKADPNETYVGHVKPMLDQDKLKNATVIFIDAITSYVPNLEGIDRFTLDKAGKNSVTFTSEGVLDASPINAIKDVSALQEGLEAEELKLYYLKGVLHDETAPTTNEAKRFFKMRDLIALEMKIDIRVDKINKAIAHYGYRFFNKYKHLPNGRRIMMEKREQPTKEEHEYANYKSLQRVAWNSQEALIAFNIDRQKNKELANWQSDSSTEKLVKLFYPENTLDGKLSGETVKVPKELEASTNFKYAGDIILTNLILSDKLKGYEQLVQKQRMFSLLALGNKNLALEVATILNKRADGEQQVESDTSPTLEPNIQMMDNGKLAKRRYHHVPRVEKEKVAHEMRVTLDALNSLDTVLENNQYYKTGGRISDERTEIGYDKYAVFRHHNKPSEPVLDVILKTVGKLFARPNGGYREPQSIYR